MRRGSSTIVSLVGTAGRELLPSLGTIANVTGFQPDSGGLEGAIDAFARAERASSPYVVVAADPLSELASDWQAMWSGAKDAAAVEVAAGRALAEWRHRRFELPDYYLVLTEPSSEREGEPPANFHLDFLKSQRSARVVGVVPAGEVRVTLHRVLEALSHLPQGPWWPSLEHLVESSRTFFPGGLTAGAE
jgi:hypothetical protein